MTGVAALYGLYAPDEVPPVVPMQTQRVSHLQAIYKNSTADLYDDFQNATEDQCWEDLQPTLKLLKPVCPEAEAWVRQQHKDGTLYYTPKGTGYYAAYHPVTQSLLLNESMFKASDGLKATVLAHEFRHSRQNFSKFLIAGMWLLLSGDLPTDLYELEAEAYQRQVWYALLGING